MGAKIILNNKEVEIEQNVEFMKSYLSERGAKIVKESNSKIEEKEFLNLSADPVTPILVLIGVGSWIYYRINQSTENELKEVLPKLK